MHEIRAPHAVLRRRVRQSVPLGTFLGEASSNAIPTAGFLAAGYPVRITSFCLSILAAGCATVQPLTPGEAQALSVANAWAPWSPDSIRLRVVADRSLTDLMDAVLLGRRPAPPTFNTSVAVWWLSESGRPEYLPTLLHFSADTAWDTAAFAIYGLSRHLGNESVRSRLLELDASAPHEVRNNMAVLLTRVNNAQARAVLARMNQKTLADDVVQRIERALRAPPETVAHVRWPCLESDRKARKPSCAE